MVQTAVSGGSRGSALLTVLVVLTVASLLGGTALTVVVQQRRLIRLDAHRLQARYAAEAGVYAALAQLEENPAWRPHRVELLLFDGIVALVTVQPFGGYYLIESTAKVRQAQFGVRAVVGARAPDLLRYAAVLGDGNAVLSVGGQTQVHGDLLLGPRGLRESAFRGAPFRGAVTGRVVDGGPSPLPAFNPALFEETLSELDHSLESPPVRSRDLRLARRNGFEGSSPERPVYTAEGPLTLSAADTLLWQEPADLFVQGDLTITDGFDLPRGSRLAASGRLRIAGAVRGTGSLLYGRIAVEAVGPVSCTAQLLSRERVVVGGRAAFHYPSVLYVSGGVTDGERRGHIELGGQATFDGTIVYPTAPAPVQEVSRVLIGPDALVRGGIYAATALELLGTVEGTVLTQQFLHRDPPRTYLSWLVDAHIDVTARPEDFALPIGLGGHAELDVLAWEPAPSLPIAP